ncbi:MAG: non-hydrolyzing UDP-N-acetylglucosamine 2-epimerase [Bacteroidota bacterium]
MKVISIVGARPQFIKLGPFSRNVRKVCNEKIIHTGQHYDEQMSALLFRDLEIPAPDYNLNIGSGNQGAQTGRMLSGIEEVLLKEYPDMIVVFGDTNSTLAGALAGVKMGIKTVHIEAGLRSFNRKMPEEINRVATDHVSDLLLAPTGIAMKNLKDEGLWQKSFLSGDIMADALKENIERAKTISQVDEQYNVGNKFYLLTLHRPYNVDNPDHLRKIFNGLAKISKKIIFPVHPRTRKIIETNGVIIPENIVFIKPLGYLDFLKLQFLSEKIITDSGGIQKEAYLLEKPCITLRTETEWMETVENGWNILVDYHKPYFEEQIINFNPKGRPVSVFGENVAQNMVNILLSK